MNNIVWIRVTVRNLSKHVNWNSWWWIYLGMIWLVCLWFVLFYMLYLGG